MRVIVIGDAMLDTYLWGKVERLSPEAPVPIVSVTKRENRLGGAANVSRNLQALGATPVLFSVVGEDDNGKEFLSLLEKRELARNGIFVDPSRNTTVKNRIISGGKQIVRVDEESTSIISVEMEKILVNAILKELDENPVDVIVFVDYDKGVVTPSLFNAINKVALERKIPTAVDPKKRNFRNYRDVTLFKPNFKEFVEGTGLQIAKDDLEALKACADKFKKEQNLKLIFITLSELGVFISNGVKEQYYPVVIRDIADVSGAGDTVISVASLAMAAGLPPKMMALMSNLAGGLVCEKLGVVPVDAEQLRKEMKSKKF
ncbi:D-glycero-beta-D-manno-heptose-7-phosphate kinase [Maribellus sp. CM-23]|uniref:bifunctional heptose 7-phosphate kinase/heptose 1-phosphate adenyltransferase n=1 Tax=Maribellus sp. CM-23 TaxID=2781026 RepID=UPI001F3B0E3F|nr:bifunctional ADP-heptose synthase [Maribellus sp. CM-23]MCE4563649.1 D-glycero-beta-D-manno-heptose-7-phosphate kinase [Maribellus sp. CM-23]